MRYLYLAALFVALPANATLPVAGTPEAPADARYCGEPARTRDGKIKRSQTQLKLYVKVHPCPATLEHSVTCEGWAVDHVIPLASGGCDIPINMQWLPDQIKSCSDKHCKDRWERIYNTVPPTKILP